MGTIRQLFSCLRPICQAIQAKCWSFDNTRPTYCSIISVDNHGSVCWLVSYLLVPMLVGAYIHETSNGQMLFAEMNCYCGSLLIKFDNSYCLGHSRLPIENEITAPFHWMSPFGTLSTMLAHLLVINVCTYQILLLLWFVSFAHKFVYLSTFRLTHTFTSLPLFWSLV